MLDRLERDPEQRGTLASSYAIFRACVRQGPRSAGVTEPPVWDGAWLQSVHNWRASTGRAVAALYRREGQAAVLGSIDVADADYGLFVSHASEDKDEVARPLATALEKRGWTVWLDELEPTVGDSLNGRIEAALAKSRFGVVVLSPALFSKQWPLRELAGLAAREVAAGSKVILPVWHNIDQHYLAQHAPILADRVGVATGAGMAHVADGISKALVCVGLRAETLAGPETIVQAVEPEAAAGSLAIPSTGAEQERSSPNSHPSGSTCCSLAYWRKARLIWNPGRTITSFASNAAYAATSMTMV